MSFVDKVRVYARGGDGGSGCLSFLREKFREFGGPDGGDGGRGGDVILQADPRLWTLLDFSRRPHIKAEDGHRGQGGDKTGRSGSDLVVNVPLGTVVYKEGRPIADLSSPQARVRVARGGRGGRGNLSFKSQHNTAPRLYEKGEPGEQADLELELKLIADVGLVGFPNAGKSTLLSRLSNARPKIADYPFTTLAPHLGLVEHKGRSFVLADIPGLIEGAHQGKGLGDAFLRHIERTRVLVHLIDPMGYGSTGAREGVRAIEDELGRYSAALLRKPRTLVVNKLDLPEAAEALKGLRGRYRRRAIFGISAATGEGLPPLLDFLIETLSQVPAPAPLAELAAPESVRVGAGFSVTRLAPERYRLSGPFVERAAAMADLSLPQSLDRFQAVLRRIGVDRALRAAGVKDGDIVLVGEFELEWAEGPGKPRGRRHPPRRPGKTYRRRRDAS